MRRRNYLRAVGGLGVGTAFGLAGTGVAAAADPCYYQVDFVAGGVEERLGESDDDFYGAQNRLIQYLHGEGDEVTKRDTWLNSLDPETRRCVSSDPIAVNNGTATVEFTVAEGCELRLSLAAYTMPDSMFNFGTADQQELADSATGTFGPGEHTLEVSLPCGGGGSSPSPPTAPPNVNIGWIHYDAGPGNEYDSLDNEFVVIRNEDDETVDLSGWTLEDPEDGQVFEFPDGVTFAPGQRLAVVTGHEGGPNTDVTLYWGRDAPAWNNDGDTVILRDADENVVARRRYAGN